MKTQKKKFSTIAINVLFYMYSYNLFIKNNIIIGLLLQKHLYLKFKLNEKIMIKKIIFYNKKRGM